MGYIYKIINLINGKEYIGKTSLTIEERFKQHIKNSKRKSFEKRPLYDAMNKYGIENFIVEEVEQCDNDLLNEKEEYWIDYYNTFHNGYNATKGGDGSSYIDYNEIIDLFREGLILKEIRDKTGHDVQWMSKILQNNGFTAQNIQDRKNERLERVVFMKDKKTNEILHTFPSVTKAAEWIKKNNYSKDKVNGIIPHISQCCNGIRKSAYTFVWSYK